MFGGHTKNRGKEAAASAETIDKGLPPHYFTCKVLWLVTT